jgi:hypothetical protein
LSVGALADTLAKLFPELSHCYRYLKTSGDVTFESELLRCFEHEVVLSSGQIKSMLPYIPLASIENALQNRFMPTYAGLYTHISKIKLDDAECRKIKEDIREEIRKNRHTSLNMVKFYANMELNPKMPDTVVLDAFFQTYLFPEFELNGKVIKLRDSGVDAIDDIKSHCLKNDVVNFQDIKNMELKLFQKNRNMALTAAMDLMIRINEDTFVSEKMIRFDVDAIDAVLRKLVADDFIPLHDVSSFDKFPVVKGYPWNLFLLESFCRKYSKAFVVDSVAINSRNAGVIRKKSSKYKSYVDVMAKAAVNESIELNEKSVGGFLFEKRYISQKNDAIIRKVIEKAKALKS